MPISGKLVEAEQMYHRALRGYEKAWGPEHTSTLDTVNNLGNLYKNQASSSRPSRCTSGRCEATRKAWGPDHTSTLRAVNNLGLLYADQGKLARAEQMYRRALQSYEKASGPEHATTLNAVYNIGNIIKQRCYAAAKLSANVYIKQLARSLY